MAEVVLSIIAEEIIKKLGSRALPQIVVNHELEKLKRTVLTIQTVLLDAEKQPVMSEQCKNYIKDLKEALYDADDLLDSFSTVALRRQVMSGIKMAKKVRIFFYGLKKARVIKEIREELDDIHRNKGFHILEGAVGTQVVTSHRETHSYIGVEEVIFGRDDDKVKFVELLKGSNLEENVSIISIVGMGGLGKTALARLVYNDDEVKNHFEKKFWVCVSDVFNIKTIIESIIVSGTNRELGNLTMDQLQMQLQEKLNGKKYLLVLDDVWEEDRNRWLELANLLMDGAKGSWIVVTTRSHKVAKLTSRVPPYILEGLSETNSWNLFVKMAFREQEPTNQNIVAIGKDIVKKCAGVPLAIRTIGSLFFTKESIEEWRSVESELSKLPQKEGDILPTLKLSYNNFEPHLKHCFAYCRLFPKDHRIDVKKLIYLWMGQGFIESSNSSRSLEQIGYEYFLSLLGRCFFQEPKEDEWGNIAWCKMHDLMHDLAVEVAGEESTMVRLDKEINIPRNTRHVSIDYDDFDSSWKLPVPLLEANKIRTFLLTKGLWNQEKEIWCQSTCAEFVSNFTRLRMLDLHGLGITRLPDSIGKLKHLRYLNLSGNHQLEILPSSIARLQNLLVLDLCYCERLKKLPKDIKKLVSLEHLEIEGCFNLTYIPQGLGQLTSLQKLTRFIVSKDHSVSKHYGGLNELNRLNNLRGELRLENLKYVKNDDSEYKAANLEGKEHLQSLVLNWRRFNGNEFDEISMEGLQPHKNLKRLNVIDYPGVGFPNWLSSLTNLVNLYLCSCGKVKHLPPLDGLSSLQDLSICDFSDLEYIDCNVSNCSRATFFSSLKELEIEFCPNLKGWRIESMQTSTTNLPPFPCLSKLNICDCPCLISMPLFPSLEGHLKLKFSSGKPLEDTMMMNSMAASLLTSSSSSPPPPLSKLKSLKIFCINDLEYLPDQGMRNLTSLESLYIQSCEGLLSLAGEGFSSLTSLRSLGIQSCQKLQSISGVFQHCTTLEKLDIICCDELDFLDDMSCQGLRSLSWLRILKLPQLVSLPKWLQHVTTLQALIIDDCNNFTTLPDWIGSLTSLQNLCIIRCSKFTSLPEGLQHVTTLQSLEIRDCNNFTTLPDWIVSLTSLQNLCISDCSKFTSLPVGMHCLTSLQALSIFKCPQLSERCGNNTGVDWPMISHIPNIYIDYRKIQLGGCYQLG